MVKRQLLELSPGGMMVQLIAEVRDPFGLKISKSKEQKLISENGILQMKNFEQFQGDRNIKNVYSKTPLFIGSFVDVKIPGRKLKKVVRIPARALRERDTVWVVINKELEIRNVKIAHIDLDNVYLSGGIEIGDKIITSPIKGAAKGLKIRIQGEN